PGWAICPGSSRRLCGSRTRRFELRRACAGGEIFDDFSPWMHVGAQDAAGHFEGGPFCNRSPKPFSSRIGTPSSTALSYFEPGESPATTKAVFLDTEPAA